MECGSRAALPTENRRWVNAVSADAIPANCVWQLSRALSGCDKPAKRYEHLAGRVGCVKRYEHLTGAVRGR